VPALASSETVGGNSDTKIHRSICEIKLFAYSQLIAYYHCQLQLLLYAICVANYKNSGCQITVKHKLLGL
jgi:hypothetical protein